MTHLRRSIAPLLFACLLVWGVATLWLKERWPRAVVEVGLCALAAWFLVCGRPRRDWRVGVLAFAAAWGVAQRLAGWTAYPYATLEAALAWTAAAAAYLVALQVSGDAGLAARFLRGAAWFGMGLAALAVVQLYTSPGRVYWIFDSGYRDNVLGPFVYRNNYAAFMELLLPLALVEAFGGRPRSLWFQAGAALMVASVIASESRAGVLLVAAEVAAVAALSWRRARPAAALLRTAALTAALTAVFGSAVVWHRLQDRDPLALRRRYLEASLEMLRQRPWTGWGLGTWPYLYPAFARVNDGMFANRAHNDWAEWAAEGGIPFVAAVGLLAAGSLGRAWRSRWGIGLIAVLLHATVDYPFARLGQAVWWFALLALVRPLAGQNHSDGADQDVQVEPQ